MSAENETIADIAAFIRKCLDMLDTELSRKSNGKPTMSAEALLCPVLNAKAALDRLDAAWKREQDPAPKSPAPTTCVNAAAMRDALVWLRKTGHRTPEGGWMCITLKMTQKDGMPHPIEVPPYAEDVINDALAAPPRNCDTGKDAKTLLDDYISIKRFSSTNQIWALYDLALPVIVWLLAQSAERKGEGDGSK